MSTDLKQVNKSKKTSQRSDNSTESKLVERLIKISRVSKVTKGGKKLSFRAIVVVGNENGQVGVGVGKADDVVNAFKKAKTDGRKNLIKIPITKSLSPSIEHVRIALLDTVTMALSSLKRSADSRVLRCCLLNVICDSRSLRICFNL